MKGKLIMYSLIFVLLCMNNLICQLKRYGWLVWTWDGIIVSQISQLSQLSQLHGDVPNLSQSHLYLPTLFFISHWWNDSDFACKIDGVRSWLCSYIYICYLPYFDILPSLQSKLIIFLFILDTLIFCHPFKGIDNVPPVRVPWHPGWV